MLDSPKKLSFATNLSVWNFNWLAKSLSQFQTDVKAWNWFISIFRPFMWIQHKNVDMFF